MDKIPQADRDKLLTDYVLKLTNARFQMQRLAKNELQRRVCSELIALSQSLLEIKENKENPDAAKRNQEFLSHVTTQLAALLTMLSPYLSRDQIPDILFPHLKND